MKVRSSFHVVGAIVVLMLIGCDQVPTVERTPTRGSVPRFTTNSGDALSLSGTYLSQDPLAAFGVGYHAFFQNPEAISDQEFIDRADATILTSNPATIESDGEFVHAYAESCAGGGQADQMMSAGECERMYNTCAARVRRIPVAKARAIGWAACMAAYAACRGSQELQ